MTYKESFQKCKTVEELIDEIKSCAYVALCLGSEGRIKHIEEAANEVIEEKGWDISNEKYDELFGGKE